MHIINSLMDIFTCIASQTFNDKPIFSPIIPFCYLFIWIPLFLYVIIKTGSDLSLTHLAFLTIPGRMHSWTNKNELECIHSPDACSFSFSLVTFLYDPKLSYFENCLLLHVVLKLVLSIEHELQFSSMLFYS
jgi:hypothetical protein